MGNLFSKLNPSHNEKMSTPPTFTHYKQAQTTFQPPLIAHTNHFLGDVASSQPNDPTAPICAGFYRLEAGTPLVYEYTYHEMKIIVDGEFDVSDGTGQTVHATRGDVFYFPKGSVITFSTPTFGLGFFCGQRKVCDLSNLQNGINVCDRKEVPRYIWGGKRMIAMQTFAGWPRVLDIERL